MISGGGDEGDHGIEVGGGDVGWSPGGLTPAGLLDTVACDAQRAFGRADGLGVGVVVGGLGGMVLVLLGQWYLGGGKR